MSVEEQILLSAAVTELQKINSLVPALFDEIVLSYTGSNPTSAVYKYNGSTVATLTLTYDGSNNLIRVQRT